MIAVVHDFSLSAAQTQKLVQLLRESRSTRPEGIVNRLFWLEREGAKLMAIWKDRDTLDRYVERAQTLPTASLLAQVDIRPAPRVVDLLEYG